MKVKSTKHYQPSFKAKVVNNQALRTTLRDIKNRYNEEYVRKTLKQISKLGTKEDEIKLAYSTFTYQKSLGMKPKAEGVTFILLNGKHIGHFENRFVSNFIKSVKEKIREQSPSINKTEQKQENIIHIYKNAPKKENIITKFIKKIIRYYKEEY